MSAEPTPTRPGPAAGLSSGGAGESYRRVGAGEGDGVSLHAPLQARLHLPALRIRGAVPGRRRSPGRACPRPLPAVLRARASPPPVAGPPRARPAARLQPAGDPSFRAGETPRVAPAPAFRELRDRGPRRPGGGPQGGPA